MWLHLFEHPEGKVDWTLILLELFLVTCLRALRWTATCLGLFWGLVVRFFCFPLWRTFNIPTRVYSFKDPTGSLNLPHRDLYFWLSGCWWPEPRWVIKPCHPPRECCVRLSPWLSLLHSVQILQLRGLWNSVQDMLKYMQHLELASLFGTRFTFKEGSVFAGIRASN